MPWASRSHRCWFTIALWVLLAASIGCESAPATPTAKFVPEEAAEPSEKRETVGAAETESDAPPEPEKTDAAAAEPLKPGADEDSQPKDGSDDEDEIFPRRVSLKKALEDESIPGGDLFPQGADWLNTGRPLKLKDLEGKFVLLDFWTYCCINCMHILPELKKLEHKYPNELVVIGVHSAKFDEEKDSQNIADAVLRYEIEHPVVNDSEHHVWNLLGVRSWPTVVLIDPQGNLVYGRPGEFKAEEFIEILDEAIAFYDKRGRMDRSDLRLKRLADEVPVTPLRYPGKILADEAGKRLFISDSNHNRIVIASPDGKLIETIGSGAIGKEDGSFASASFDHPQGCALVGDMLYVADTENHLLRKVDLKSKTVTTIAGTGNQARYPWPGLEQLAKEMAAAGREGRDQPGLPERWVGKPLETALNSPWALWPHDGALYVAMAGPHQIWKMPLDESEIGPYAGNGREDIVDGPLVPTGDAALQHALGYSSFAQPSGLSSDGEWLFVADSEGSSIRAVPFDPTQKVRTVIGTNDLEHGRLFEFGDVDGEREIAKLQHPLEALYHDGVIYVADTYNNKVKAVDAKTGATKTFVGTGEAGKSDDAPSFDEPAGLAILGDKLYVADTNNSLIRVVDLKSRMVSTLQIEGLAPPTSARKETVPDFSDAMRIKANRRTVKPVDGKITLDVAFDLPPGWKMNPLAPAAYFVAETTDAGMVAETALGKHKFETPTASFRVELPVKSSGETTISVSMNYYYCQEKDAGVCKVGSVVFEQPVTISDDAEASSIELRHAITDEAP